MAMLVHFQMSVVCYLPSTSGQTLSETLVITESGDVYSLTVAAGKCNLLFGQSEATPSRWLN